MDDVAIRHIRNAGVVGAGGAGFPSHVKFSSPAEIVIANGAECEPLLESDRHLMLQRPRDIVDGLKKAIHLVDAKRGIMAIKEKHEDLKLLYSSLLEKEEKISLVLLPDIYPMGDEQVLVYQSTGRLVPPGGLPLSVNCVVSNVTTLFNLKEAVDLGKAVTERFVTINGCVNRPHTRSVAIGTSVGALLEAAGGLSLDDAVIISGGPMTGRIVGPEGVVSKTVGGILALPPESYIVKEKQMSIDAIKLQSMAACFQCRDCTRVCPRWQLGYPFEPHLVMRASNYGIEEAKEILSTAHYCCDCGLCSTIGCQTMKLSPRRICNHLKSLVEKPKNYEGSVEPPDIPLEDQQVPSKRITMRHMLSDFAHTEFCYEPLEPKEVFIPLLQHIGAPAKAVVQGGQAVSKGDLIAEIPRDSLGANVHASIEGTVKSVQDEGVYIVA